jgi:hypothetical protein
MGPGEPDDYWESLDVWADAVDALWESHAWPSPGGWSAPSEAPQGMVARLERVPWWVRIWYHTPFLDRRARVWMWVHGGFDVIPRSVKLPPQPSPPASSPAITLPLTGRELQLGEMRWADPYPGLLHSVGGSRVITGRRRIFNEPWASMACGIRPAPDPVSVWFSRTRVGRRVRKQAEVVYGPEGLWGAEILGRWDVVEVRHAGQTHSLSMGLRGRGWRLRTPREQSGAFDIIYEP